MRYCRELGFGYEETIAAPPFAYCSLELFAISSTSPPSLYTCRIWLLMGSIIQMLKTVGAIPRFYMIWISLTAAAVTYVVWLVGRAATPRIQKVQNAPNARTPVPRPGWRGR